MLRYTPKNSDLPPAEEDGRNGRNRPGAYSIDDRPPVGFSRRNHQEQIRRRGERQHQQQGRNNSIIEDGGDPSVLSTSSIPPELRSTAMMTPEMDNNSPNISDENANENAGADVNVNDVEQNEQSSSSIPPEWRSASQGINSTNPETDDDEDNRPSSSQNT